MAWRMQLQLPRFKVTQIFSSGVVHRNVPRGKKAESAGACSSSRPTTSSSGEEPTANYPDLLADPGLPPGDDGQNVSLHAVKQKASTASWHEIRPLLLESAVESSAMQNGQLCITCSEDATYRCVQCSPCSHYCRECFGRAHSKRNIFHTGEVWEVSSYALVACWI